MSILAKTGFSKDPDSFRAGVESAQMASEDIKEPNLIILFASIYHNHEMVLKGLRSVIKDTPLIGGSTFGEMTNYGMNDNSVVLMAIKTDRMKFSLGLGNDSDKDPVQAGEEAAREAIKGLGKNEPQAGIFISEMLGGAKALNGLQNVLPKGACLFGGCSSGNRKVPISNPEFTEGYQYFNDSIYRHSVPLLLLSGDFKCSFGVGHGWRPLGKTVKVGRTEKNKIYELDNISAFDFYKRYLGESSFVPYPLGFYQNDYLILRATTGTAEKGGLYFTTEIAPETEVRITRGSRANIYKSSHETTQQVLDSLGGAKPRMAIIFSCISRRTMLGARTYKEVEVIQEVLGKELPLIGCYSAGEYAPVSGRNVYHNFSFCLCLLGEEIGEKLGEVTIEIPGKPKIKKDKILIITKKENLVSDCKAALTEFEIDFEWIKDNLEIEDSLEKNIPNIVILDIENEPLIQRINKAAHDIQIILFIEKEKEASSMEIVQKLGESIYGFCFIPFRMFELQFLVKKALQINKMYVENKRTTLQLTETKEHLDEAEEQIEVTEKVVMQSYNEIESAHDYIRNVIKSMIDALIVTDPKGKIKTVNQATLNLLEYKEEELLSKAFEVIFSEKLKETELRKSIDSEQLTNQETYIRSKNGRKIPVLLSSSAMKDKNGNTIAIVYTVKDITERKQAEGQLKHVHETLQKQVTELRQAKEAGLNMMEDLERENAERKQAEEALEITNRDLTLTTGKLEELNRELRDFVYIASHDLREPLRKISSFGELLKDSLEGKLNKDDQENLEFMVDGANRMTEMINGLLVYSWVNTKGISFQAVDLNEIAEQLEQLELAVLLEETGGTIEVPQPLPTVEADPVQMRQLLQNLIANGIKYRRDEVRPRIVIRAKHTDEDKVRIEVQDNGIGIRQEHYEDIFTMFRRLHPRQRYGGTGIGLALCRKIIDTHGGRIGVESKYGEGTTLWFTLSAASEAVAVS